MYAITYYDAREPDKLYIVDEGGFQTIEKFDSPQEAYASIVRDELNEHMIYSVISLAPLIDFLL